MSLKRRSMTLVIAAALMTTAMPGIAAAQGGTTLAAASTTARPPSGQGSYQDLLRTWGEFLEWRTAQAKSKDFSPAAIEARRAQVGGYLSAMENMNVAGWERAQQVDWLAARAKMNEEDFLLRVSKPWERDPGFYVDQMLRVSFTELPVKGAALTTLRGQLREMPAIVARAKATLRNVPGDYADLALHNLANADGVGHGHPYREVPPAGIIGWFDDLEARAKTTQPAILPDIRAARAAAADLRTWLEAERPKMTAPAGVGEANFNWYVKNVKLLPYNTDQLRTIGNRETERLWGMHALEKHRNRNLPELPLPASEADYEKRKADTLRDIHAFLKDEEIITVPADIGYLYVNVPWIVRPNGPNFWEQIQYRDPSPDLFHATIPGHAFDGQMDKRDTHPIRSKIDDGVRTEGWGTYLEEAAQRLGFFDKDRARTRELIDLFGIFRAVRVAGDLDLQLNRANVSQVVAEWQKYTPWLDADVARVDAEIYLRRPPGYGLGYTIGMVEMQKLLGDVRRHQGDKFVLRDFHDRMMTIGRIPLSLIRFEMTGNDDEVSTFWRRDPLPGGA